MSDLIIIGGGGHAKSVADLALKNGFNIIGFLDDSDAVTDMLGIKRLGAVSDCEKYAEVAKFVIGIGNNSVRRKIYETYKINYETLIHPSAVVGTSVVIENGAVIMAGAVINADTKVGKQAIINTGAVVEHDCVIGEFTMVAPGSTVCGFSKIGNNCWLGAGCVVNNVIDICDNTTVGSGGVVIKSIVESGTYVGVPVRRIK